MRPYVLVVEDDPDVRTLVVETLHDAGYTAEAFADGREALRRAAAQRPSLILLDHNMPCLDGPTFAQRYRDLPGPHAPIVLMTADPDVARTATVINAEAWLAKPFDLDALEALVGRLCGAAPAQPSPVSAQLYPGLAVA